MLLLGSPKRFQPVSVPSEFDRNNLHARRKNGNLGNYIFMYLCSHTVKTKESFSLSNEISSVEHENMNICKR